LWWSLVLGRRRTIFLIRVWFGSSIRKSVRASWNNWL